MKRRRTTSEEDKALREFAHNYPGSYPGNDPGSFVWTELNMSQEWFKGQLSALIGTSDNKIVIITEHIEIGLGLAISHVDGPGEDPQQKISILLVGEDDRMDVLSDILSSHNISMNVVPGIRVAESKRMRLEVSTKDIPESSPITPALRDATKIMCDLIRTDIPMPEHEDNTISRWSVMYSHGTKKVSIVTVDAQVGESVLFEAVGLLATLQYEHESKTAVLMVAGNPDKTQVDRLRHMTKVIDARLMLIF